MPKTIIKKSTWWLFVSCCILIGVYPSLYAFIDRKFGLLSTKTEYLLSDTLWNFSFYNHIIFGGLALLIGWLQFHQKLRQQNISLHRKVGFIYLLSVLISGISSLYIALYATGGIISIMGFFSLGLIWLYTSLKGLLAIRKGAVNQHQKYLIYSYAACFAAVTLRIWLPILSGITGDFISAYRIVSWLCWVPNLLLAYFLVPQKV